MKLRSGINIFLVLGGAGALSLKRPLSSSARTQSSCLKRPSGSSSSRSITSIAISINEDDFEPEESSSGTNNGQRFRNGLKRWLRKPEEPRASSEYAPVTTIRDREDEAKSSEEPVVSVLLADNDDLTTSISVRSNASTNINSARRKSRTDPDDAAASVLESHSEISAVENDTSQSVMPSTTVTVNGDDNQATKNKGQIAAWRKTKEDQEIEAKSKSRQSLEDKRDNKILHILGLMAGTLWWYIFSSYEFLTKPDVFDIFDIYSSGNVWLYNGMSTYVTVSQLCTYFFLWKLMTTNSLREGQAWIGLCILACVPADTIVILFDPTGSKSLTVLAFTLVTLIYGVLLAFYLREAAALEPNPTNDIYKDNDAHNMLQEVIHYRPPADLQNTHMALDFARSFGAFTITVAAMRDQLGIGEVGMVYYATLFVVVAHAALEMTLTTVTPGLDLCQYRSWIKFQTFMSLFEMFAATYIAHVAPEEDLTIWDDLVYSCLFGSAAAALQEYAALWGEEVDFDTKLGMANAEISNQSTTQ